MPQLKQSGDFACNACGSPAIVLPSELHDDAPIRCDGCGGLIARWGAFKARAEAIIAAEGAPPRPTYRAEPGADL